MTALTLLLISCGSPQEESKVKVSVGAVTGSANFPGGLVVIGKNIKTGQKFTKVVSPTDADEIILSNGVWSFAAIGWTEILIMQASPAMKVKCEVIAQVNLTGGDFNLVMNTSNAKCNNSIFGSQLNGDANFDTLRLNTCLDIKAFIDRFGGIPEGIVCDPSNDLVTGNAAGVIVQFIESNIDGSLGPGLKTDCLSGFSGDGSLDTMVSLPFGSTNFDVPIIIETYTDGACTADKKTYIFDRSFSKLAKGSIGAVTQNNTDNVLDAYLHIEACTGANLVGPNPIGTSGGPYIICNNDQFEKIGDGSPHETTATYILAHDIDFGGDNTTIAPAFAGNLEGRGYTLKNGDEALFNTITNSASNDVRLSDFKIENFDLTLTPATDTTSYGILANYVSDATAGSRVEIDRIEIDSDSFIDVSTASLEIRVGALIGSVDFSTAVSDEDIHIRNIVSYANVTNSAAFDIDNATGGLVGKFSGSAINNASIELSQVGVDLKNPNTSFPLRVSIKGDENVGGVVGHIINAEIRENVFAVTQFTHSASNASNIGGVVGFAGASRISNTKSDMNYIPSSSTTSVNVGGVIGKVNDADSVEINGSVASFTINDAVTNNTIVMNNLGGLVGALTSGGSSNLSIRHSRAHIKTYIAGSYHGGIIGYHAPTSAGGASLNIESTVAMGTIALDTSTSPSSGDNYRGGIAGYAQHLKSKRVIVDTFEVEGFEYIGGAYAYSSGADVKLEESSVKASITSKKATTPYRVGGIVGASSTSIVSGAFQSIYANVSLDFPLNTGVDCTGDACGLLVGDQQAAPIATYFNAILFELPTQPITDGDATDPSTVFCDGNCVGGETANLFSDETNSGDCSTLIGQGPFEFTDSLCQLSFKKNWESLGFDSTSSIYLAGSIAEPFPIYNEDDWNAIGDDSLLVSKSYELKNNINFTAAVNPIGTNNMSTTDAFFTGSIIPNGFKLFNVAENSGAVDASGVFQIIGGGARIGMRGDPLVIEGLDLDCAIGNCGFIGRVRSDHANIYVQIKNGDINTGGLNWVGGLIGTVTNSATAYIKHSSFEGKILGGGGTIGGLIGAVTTGASVEIEDSYTNTTKIAGTNNVGGMIGNVVSASSLRVENSYVLIDPLNNNASDDLPNVSTSGGLFGNNSLAGAEVINTFVDIGNANIGGLVEEITTGSAFAGGTTTFTIGSANTSITGATHASGLTYATLFTDPNFEFEDGGSRGFTKNAAGKAVLNWQINGFDDY